MRRWGTAPALSGSLDFNPRTPHGVRPDDILITFALSLFQSTHPSRGATSRSFMIPTPTSRFQSTHPSRGATGKKWRLINAGQDFNPRTPHGVRLYYKSWEAKAPGISIHAPLTGCDYDPCRLPSGRADFNPRTPHGVRPALMGSIASTTCYFNPRTPHGVRLSIHPTETTVQNISIHAPLTGCDTM